MKRESLLTSSSSTEGQFAVARLGRPHGLEGFLGLYVEPEDLVHFETGASVFIEGNPYIVKTIRRVDRGYQIAFEGVDRVAADELRGSSVLVPGRRELDEGEFWPETLIGLEARGSEGKRLGSVVGVIAGVAQDRLVIESDGATFEVPFVDDLVPVVDPEAGYIEIIDLPGLIEP